MAGSIYDHRASMKSAANELAAGGYTLSAARVKLGIDVLTPNADMIRQLATEGPYLIIRTGAKVNHEAIGTTRISTYEVQSDLFIGLDRNADNDMVNVETFLEALDAAWVDWPTTWEAPEIDLKQNSAVVHYVLKSEVRAGC